MRQSEIRDARPQAVVPKVAVVHPHSTFHPQGRVAAVGMARKNGEPRRFLPLLDMACVDRCVDCEMGLLRQHIEAHGCHALHCNNAPLKRKSVATVSIRLSPFFAVCYQHSGAMHDFLQGWWRPKGPGLDTQPPSGELLLVAALDPRAAGDGCNLDGFREAWTPSLSTELR